MGLFGSKKTYVSSVLYNMAGPEENRSSFLKTTITGNLITDNSNDLSDVLQKAYIRGPGLKLRSFYRWAENNYNIIGVPKSQTSTLKAQNNAVLEQQIPHGPEQGIRVQTYELSLADFSYWAEQRMMDQYPSLLDTDWVSDFNETTGEIVITFEDGSKNTFVPSDFVKRSPYLYATYFLTNPGSVDPVQTGELVQLGSDGTMPSTSGWDLDQTINTSKSYTLHTVTKKTVTYSDNRPVEETTNDVPSTINSPDAERIYSKTVYDGADESTTDTLYSTKYTMHQFESHKIISTEETTTSNETIDGGVTKTTTQVVTTDSLVVDKSYRVDTQRIANKNWSGAKLFIYRLGSGNTALDALFTTQDDSGQYVPYIPLRLDNKYITEINRPDAYEQAKKAYKKALGGDFDEMLENLDDNPSIGDIDFAYVMFGVPLNVLENSSRKYLFLFFDKLRQRQQVTEFDRIVWDQQNQTYIDQTNNWFDWKEAQSNPANPYYGQTEPSVSRLPITPENVIRIKSDGSLSTNMDMEITWQTIVKTTGSGLKKPNAKKDEIWLSFQEDGGNENVFYTNGFLYNLVNRTFSTVYINWQIDENNWQQLAITNLKHKNYIYNGKFIETTAYDAWNDSDESGFLVPLHYPTVREMSLVDSTQMMTAASYMVFNCYKVVKQKWYQTGIFKILVVVAIVAITIATGGTGAVGAGLLGSASSVGTALGLSGLAAVIAGAVANAIVGMIVMKIIQTVSVVVLGEKIGAIIGAIAATIAITVGTSMASGVDFHAALGVLAKPQNLIKLTEATGNGLTQAIASEAASNIRKTQELLDDYKKESKEISQRFMDEFGYDKADFNPLGLTDLGKIFIETEDQFLSRTLLTGDDFARISQEMIENFAKIGVSTKLPI